MEALRQYALSLICGALIVGILLDLSEKSGFKQSIRLVCSIFFACVLIRPLLSLSIPELSQLGSSYQTQAEAAAAQGENIRIRSIASIIRQECEAYILKEARAIGAEVEVEFELDTAYPPAPSAVTVRGVFDADIEATLSRLLADELGIPKEHQTWIRQQPHFSGNSSQNTSIVS